MAFIKQIDLPNGAMANYHKIVQVCTNRNLDGLQVQVGSWPSYDIYLQDRPPIWNHYIDLDLGSVVERAENLLLLNGEFAGATVVQTTDDLLEKARIKQWIIIKTVRDRVEFGGFVWDNSIFDSDSQSQSRIQGGVQLAQLAQQANQPFSITWTLQDNSTRVLNGQDMISVGMALAQHVQAVHQTGRSLREQINNATTVEQVESIQWPV